MKTEKPIIYCIPGTGVDGRVFSLLDFGDYEVKYIHWVVPHKRESMNDYALRLAKQIDASRPIVLIGLSFGGMLCATLMSHLDPKLVILISSCKSKKELPPKIRFLKAIPFYRLFPDAAFIKAAAFSRKIFGFHNKADAALFLDMLKTAPRNFYSRAIDCIVHWDAKDFKPGVVHIHGTRDRVLPLSFVKADYVIEGGSHNMLNTHHDEISRIIRKELEAVAMNLHD